MTTAGSLAALVPMSGGQQQSGASPVGPPSMEEVLPRGFQLDVFDAALATSVKQKHLFACITEASVALTATRSTLNAYHVLGVPATDVQTVVVFYHGVAVLSAFDDAMWARYVRPTNNAPASDAKKITGNPLMKKKGGEWDSSIPALVATADTRFFVCNLATHGYASRFATQLHLSAKDVYEDLASHLIPNAMLVPAGVWAIHAIQERQYTLLQFS